MTTLNIPKTNFFRNASFGLEENTETFTSPISNTTQTISRTGARWYMTLNYNPMERSDANEVLGFLTGLRGQVNSMFAFDPLGTQPTGDMSGSTLVVNGASQTGVTLVCDGAKASTLILKAGDYFQVGSELKMITSDATSDSSGNVTLNFAPSLRSSPSDNATIITSNPKCIMKLVDDNTTWNEGTNSFYTISFSAIEVF